MTEKYQHLDKFQTDMGFCPSKTEKEVGNYAFSKITLSLEKGGVVYRSSAS